jgi:hypothetical protein
MLDRNRINNKTKSKVLVELVADTQFGICTIIEINGKVNLLNTDSIINTLVDKLDLNDNEEVEVKMYLAGTNTEEVISVHMDHVTDTLSGWVTKIEIVNIEYNDK